VCVSVCCTCLPAASPHVPTNTPHHTTTQCRDRAPTYESRMDLISKLVGGQGCAADGAVAARNPMARLVDGVLETAQVRVVGVWVCAKRFCVCVNSINRSIDRSVDRLKLKRRGATFMEFGRGGRRNPLNTHHTPHATPHSPAAPPARHRPRAPWRQAEGPAACPQICTPASTRGCTPLL
jgi:hypothetical protein